MEQDFIKEEIAKRLNADEEVQKIKQELETKKIELDKFR